MEKQKRWFLRKILERVYIKENKERCMNLNEGIGVNTIYIYIYWNLKRGRSVFKIIFIVN